MSSVRAQLEDAVIALLKGLQQDGKVVQIEPYAGQLAGVTTMEDVKRALGGGVPGILVSSTRGKFREISVKRDRVRRDVTLELFIAHSHQGSREARQRAEGGIYDLLDACLERLIGAEIGDLVDDTVAAGVLEPVSEEVLAHDPALCLWSLELNVTVMSARAVSPAADALDIVTSIENLTGEDGDTAGNPAITFTNPGDA